MSRIVILLIAFVFSAPSVFGQSVKNASYQTVAHIKSDGTVQDSGYRTIGHADGIPLKWAAFYFFFSKD